MNATRLAIAAAVSALAFGVQAQTIETDYPAFAPAGPVVAEKSQAPEGTRERVEPVLVQSNHTGPEMNGNALGAQAESRTRAEVQGEAVILVPRSPGLNA